MQKIIIVVPTYNERENIELLLEKIFAVNPYFEILFVDDNSPDQTADLIEKIMLRDKRVYLLKRGKKEGLGRAYIDGFKVALALNPGYIIQMDGDLSHNPQYLNQMLEEVKSYDLVIGSRYIRGGGSLDWGWFRAIISRIGAFFCRTITGVKIRDTLGGFKCFRAQVLKNIDFSQIKSSGFFFQLEMNYLITEKGYTYKEIPILFLKRNCGKSKFSLGIIWEAIISVWRLKLK